MTEAEQEERVADLAEEFLSRLRSGEGLSITAFAEAHPECREELLELLPAMVDMEGLSRDSRPRPAVTVSFPDELGGYLLLEKIGVGGMGTVFRAMQKSLNREVAVKILSPAWSAEARHLKAFENESRVIAGLRHTNIVEVYGAGQEGELRYYVMSLVRGKGVSPTGVMQAFPGIPYARAVAQVGYQAALGLAFAHEHGVVHRDVKPGNLLLDEQGVIHVSDFGLATVLNEGEVAPLVTQSHDGTLRYMSPERLTRGENSFAGDQYALGLTLYELLTRRAAFTATDPGQLIHRICHEPLPPLKGEGELGAIINKSISFSPGDRYTSMRDMADDLRRYLEGEPVRARAASTWRRYIMWMKRRPAVAIWSHAAALLVLLLTGSVSIGYLRVRQALEQENIQRQRAEQNALIADNALQRVLQRVSDEPGSDSEFLHVTKEDVRLIQDLMPYYEALAAQDAQPDEQVGRACGVLASIALKTQDFSTAEEYYRRAVELLPARDLESVKLRNGLAATLMAQHSPEKSDEARQLLCSMVQQLRRADDWEVRLELVRSLQLVMMQQRPPFAPPPHHPKDSPPPAPEAVSSSPAASSVDPAPADASSRSSADEPSRSPADEPSRTLADKESRPSGSPARARLMEQAVALMVSVLQEKPDEVSVRLRQAELLGMVRRRDLTRKLSPEGLSPLDIIEDVLRQNPSSEAAQRAFVRQVCSMRGREAAGVAMDSYLSRARDYAQSLLASSPGDTGMLMLYLTTCGRRVASLLHSGQQDAAEQEREQMIGVVNLLTSRSDFSPELKQRIVGLLSRRHPGGSPDGDRQDELTRLLKSHDEQRRGALRQRMHHLRDGARRGRPKPPGRPSPPPKPGKK